ncbi:hypothetical protein MMC10_000911 [Thelotrema lepadinum]|nr:hypothetical protein [Thelotrema lepadinum]
MFSTRSQGRGKHHPSSGRRQGLGGKGLGLAQPKRHRRLARRGGVKRISAAIYDDIRGVVRSRLEMILKECAFLLEYKQRQTVTVTDVVFVLRRLGTPIWGFEPTGDQPIKA